jgi:hypothetical protein
MNQTKNSAIHLSPSKYLQEMNYDCRLPLIPLLQQDLSFGSHSRNETLTSPTPSYMISLKPRKQLARRSNPCKVSPCNKRGRASKSSPEKDCREFGLSSFVTPKSRRKSGSIHIEQPDAFPCLPLLPKLTGRNDCTVPFPTLSLKPKARPFQRVIITNAIEHDVQRTLVSDDFDDAKVDVVMDAVLSTPRTPSSWAESIMTDAT